MLVPRTWYLPSLPRMWVRHGVGEGEEGTQQTRDTCGSETSWVSVATCKGWLVQISSSTPHLAVLRLQPDSGPAHHKQSFSNSYSELKVGISTVPTVQIKQSKLRELKKKKKTQVA